MFRKACGSFVLMRAGELPGDFEVEEPYSLAEVFDWYQECPEQIERVVIMGGRSAKQATVTAEQSFIEFS